MKRLALATATSLLLTLSAHAQDTDYEARLAVAKEYVEISVQNLDLNGLIQTMWQPVVNQIKLQGKQLSDEQIGKIDTLYQDTMTEPLKDIMRDQDVILVDLFTLEELVALRDFYASPAGASVMQKLPKVMAAQQPQIMMMVQTKVPYLMSEVKKIANDQ